MSSYLCNFILRALPPELTAFRAKLTAVSLPTRTTIYEPHVVPKFAHFLTSGVASVTTSMKDGGMVETGMWGHEGLIECMHLGCSDCVPSRCFMQIGGTALRMPYDDLQRDYEALPPLREVIQHSIQIQALIQGQLVACKGLHEIQERLARRLLMLQDRVQGDELRITHESVGQMLGSSRSSISLAAGVLQRRGLIGYQRGCLHILDRQRLESAACECYSVIRSLSERLPS
jgi:CRP-like cAMP-binding protein